MKYAKTTLIAYSALLIIGGIIGFAISGSAASIIMSTLFALGLFGCTYLMNSSFYIGKYISYSLLSFLTLFFVYRWIYTQKFMPSGIMTFLTIFAFAFVLHHLERKKTLS